MSEHAIRVGGPSFGASARAFMVPDDVQCVRATAEKWNVAGLCGPFAELFFSPHEERCEKKEPVPRFGERP